jgi:tungstate transport system substrate-binding protein
MRKTLFTAIAAATATLIVAPGVASADSSSSLTVVGTSDVSDSGLIQNVIEPDFHAAYPQFTFKYIGTATGTAIDDAESGSEGASALIVHAASLENQFVAGGYSYNDQYGYAIWRNDFVLAGPTGDPAGVASNGASNVTQAFADIATAGINGGGTPKATFVSRGGTPGTTVEEHAIWALVSSSGLAPSGLLLCAVNSTDGGGETPIAAGNGVTASGQPCPNGGALPSGSELPDWYVTTGLTQGPNVVAANACNGYPSGANSCYVLTDRGTYDYLASGSDPAGTIPNLTIVTRGPQSASAPGGAYALINYFHAYIINPSKPNEQINLPAAKDFIDLITSPGVQAQLKTYLDDTSDPAGAPFVADASPTITESGLPKSVAAGKTVTVTGSVTNAELGYPVLAGKAVSVDQVIGGLPVPVASAKTDTSGDYKIKFVPTSSGAYEVVTPQITAVENSTLNPIFADLLSPGASAAVQVTVKGLLAGHSLSFSRVTVKRGKLTVNGTLKPAPVTKGTTVWLLALASTGGAQRKLAHKSVPVGSTKFKLSGKLKPGTWIVQLEYVHKGTPNSFSKVRTVHVK